MFIFFLLKQTNVLQLVRDVMHSQTVIRNSVAFCQTDAKVSTYFYIFLDLKDDGEEEEGRGAL